jgi:hypothetical protein
VISEKDTALDSLAVADTLRKIAAEQNRYEREVIDAVTFAERVGELLVRLDRVFPRPTSSPSPAGSAQGEGDGQGPGGLTSRS